MTTDWVELRAVADAAEIVDDEATAVERAADDFEARLKKSISDDDAEWEKLSPETQDELRRRHKERDAEKDLNGRRAFEKMIEPGVNTQKFDFVKRQLGREHGQQIVDSLKFQPPTEIPVDGTDWLSAADPPLRLAVEGSVNVLYGQPDRPSIWTVSALFKFGKTTFVADLVRCAADGDKWGGDLLGFKVNLDEGRRIVHLNYEVADRTLKAKWYRPLGVERPDRFSVISVRPAQMRLSSAAAADWTVEQLRNRAAQIWVVDTFSRCGANTGEEISNDKNIEAYDRILEIGARAGVELVIVIDHMAKSGDGTTARGGTAKQDYPDDFTTGVLANPSDPSSDRVITTRGRSDDDQVELRYRWDKATRRHQVVEAGGSELRRRAESDAKMQTMWREAVDALARAGGPASTTTVKSMMSTGDMAARNGAISRLKLAGVVEHTGGPRSPLRLAADWESTFNTMIEEDRKDRSSSVLLGGD